MNLWWENKSWNSLKNKENKEISDSGCDSQKAYPPDRKLFKLSRGVPHLTLDTFYQQDIKKNNDRSLGSKPESCYFPYFLRKSYFCFPSFCRKYNILTTFLISIFSFETNPRVSSVLPIWGQVELFQVDRFRDTVIFLIF